MILMPVPSEPSVRRKALARRAVAVAGVLVVAGLGAGLGIAVAPATDARLGPFQADVRVMPSTRADLELLLPPAGRVSFDTHLSPVAVQVRMGQVDLQAARALISSPTRLRSLTATAPGVLRQAVLQAAATSAGCAVVGSALLAVLVYRRRWRRTALVTGSVLGLLAGTAGMTFVSFDADRLAQPRFTGLLSEAPYVARDAASLVDRLESYRSGLADILSSVTTLYATAGGLPVLPGGSASADLVTVLHVSDLHLNPLGFDLIDRLVTQFGVDVVMDTGDITTWGTEVESRTLSRISQVGVPYVFVRGNHDSKLTQSVVARQRRAVVLDGTVSEVGPLVVAGIGDPEFTPDPEQASEQPARSTVPAPSPSLTPALTPAPTPALIPAPVLGPIPADNGGGGRDPQIRAGARLADLIRSWNAAHPDRPVQVAAMHDPAGAAPLLGVTPLLLAGHLHQRSQRIESGTRVMVEASTGGAGLTARGLARLTAGDPLPLSATLIYLARSGPRAGQVLAYDTVTVGGLGLASVSLERQVVRDPATADGGLPATGSVSRTGR